MKHLKNTLILFFIIAFSGIGKAQNCYEVIKDMSGIDISPYQIELENAACELRQAFPAEFQDKFKVYGFGFYSRQEFMEGGFQAIWDNVVSEIPTEYYLIFGKQSDHTGIYTKFGVDVKLPERGSFSCYTDIEREYINFSVLNSVNSKYAKFDNHLEDYYEAEKAGMKELMKIVERAKSCCEESSMREPCTLCPENPASIKAMLKDNDFVEIPLSELTVQEMVDTNGIVKQYSQLDIRIEGKNIDVNTDIKEFLNKLSLKMEGIQGTISNFDYTNQNCLDIMDIIFETNESGYIPSAIQGKKNNHKKSDNNNLKYRSSAHNYLFKVDVISLIDENDEAFLYVRNKSKFDISDYDTS